jgi:peptidylprolyl isomerase
MWISIGSALMRRSLFIWQLAFPKGLGAAARKPRIAAPSTPVIFDVQLLYMPNVSDFDE